MTDHHVIDANFFISVAQTRQPRAMDRVLDLAKGLGWELHTTEPILEEVRYVRSKRSKHTASDLARAMMEVHPSDEDAIVAMRNDLGGGHRAPQAPDLTLMVVADSLSRKGDSVKLVSDDFKISTSSKELGHSYAVISPSVYLFTLSRELTGNDKKEVRALYKRVRHGEMEYVLQRADMYNVEDKLTWLMDNLLHSVTEPEERVSSSAGRIVSKEQVGTVPREEGDWNALIRHLRGERVRRGHIKAFDPIMPHLEPLGGLKPVLIEIHDVADGGELENALALCHESLGRFKSRLQLSIVSLGSAEARQVLRAYAELLPHLEMVTALLHINLGEVLDCEDHLDNVALLALAAGLTATVVEANYLEALVHAYREAWEGAYEQFLLTSRLAEQAEDDATVLRSLIGAAVSCLLSGDRDEAENIMARVNETVEADCATGSIALEEFGDHFTNFGATHIATGMYNEALECAVESKSSEDATRLVGKVRRSRLSMGLEDRETACEVKELIDMANDIQDSQLLERFEGMERELAQEVARMDEPLEGNCDQWSPSPCLPDPLEEWMEIIRADPLPKGGGTMLVCYSPQVGNVGVLINDVRSLPGIELARFRFTESSRVKMVEAPEPFRSGYRLRALIVLHEDDPYMFSRSPIRLRRRTGLEPEPDAYPISSSP